MQFVIPDNAARVAVAVSGGADSMALLHMVASCHADVHAITVDHGLRTESAAEAKQVADWVSAWPGVTHTILRWEGAKPQHGVPQSAREARYALMADYCRKADIAYLAVAHHGDDQAETFFMRLARGSGLDGLAAMRVTQIYDEHLTLWRPLLHNASHGDLITYCRDNDVPWVEDPSNANTNYTRNRLRAALRIEGLSEKRLSVTMRRLERAADALRELSARLLEKALRDKKDDSWILDLRILRDEPFELAVRVVRSAIDTLGNAGDYGARFEKVESVTRACLAAQAPYSTTLGGCTLRVNARRATLAIARENLQKSAKSLPLSANGL